MWKGKFSAELCLFLKMCPKGRWCFPCLFIRSSFWHAEKKKKSRDIFWQRRQKTPSEDNSNTRQFRKYIYEDLREITCGTAGKGRKRRQDIEMIYVVFVYDWMTVLLMFLSLAPYRESALHNVLFHCLRDSGAKASLIFLYDVVVMNRSTFLIRRSKNISRAHFTLYCSVGPTSKVGSHLLRPALAEAIVSVFSLVIGRVMNQWTVRIANSEYKHSHVIQGSHVDVRALGWNWSVPAAMFPLLNTSHQISVNCQSCRTVTPL